MFSNDEAKNIKNSINPSNCSGFTVPFGILQFLISFPSLTTLKIVTLILTQNVKTRDVPSHSTKKHKD
jgi:hypothetical protein